jgi:hypothetical protein
MKAVSTSETSVNLIILHGATSQKTVIFIFAALKILKALISHRVCTYLKKAIAGQPHAMKTLWGK